MANMINDSINCTIFSQQLVGIYTVVIYAPLAVVYVIVAILFIKHPMSFHPLFVLSFFLMLLAYTFSNFILFFRNLIEFLMEENWLFTTLEFIFVYANYYTQPIIVLALLERLIATLTVSSYEKSRHWFIYTIGQIICIFLVITMSVSEDKADIISNVQLSLSFISCVVLIILFFVNRYITSHSVGRHSLTTRYQLAENIKALRIFVPFLLLDNFISIMFIVSNLVIGVGRKFNENECRRSPNYWLYFLIFRTIAIIIQISMAILVVHFHDSMKFPKFSLPLPPSRTRPQELISVTHVLQIKNVLGKNIVEAETAENYFSQLEIQWK
ncbi:unnamed protein product [Caenorhabditis angaria]|uniref:Uncharacterized protein n=1 Tax=Caenorhabditis angaria TaxID=860376 RepID=A0A9P1N6F9_9PELO|nr:unnamed protein product [Caenorhabditis angaria]